MALAVLIFSEGFDSEYNICSSLIEMETKESKEFLKNDHDNIKKQPSKVAQKSFLSRYSCTYAMISNKLFL